MDFGEQDRVFVLTGAGISAESGLATFRGSGGLWNGHRVEDVATPEAWEADPQLVWNFYSMRRRDAQAAQPNEGHRALARLEAKLGERMFLCTQNVDDLHERGGSERVHHMHGQLAQSRCVRCNKPFEDWKAYERALPVCACKAAVRPNIVWFGEQPFGMNKIHAELTSASHLLVIGTSGNVYPAAGFVRTACITRAKTIYVGPEAPLNAAGFDEILMGTAVEILPGLVG